MPVLGLLVPALIAVAPAQEARRHFLAFFEWDSTTLSPEAAEIVDYAAEEMLKNPALKATLSGHTDRTGTTDYNIAKSQRMADAVASYLVIRGVARERITVIALGDTRPRVETGPDIREPLNRRVEIDLTGD